MWRQKIADEHPDCCTTGWEKLNAYLIDRKASEWNIIEPAEMCCPKGGAAVLDEDRRPSAT